MGLSEGIKAVGSETVERTVDTLKLPLRIVKTEAGAIADSTALAVGRTLRDTVIDKETNRPPPPLKALAETGWQIIQRVGRAGAKLVKNIVTLHPIRAVTQPVAELGLGAVETVTGLIDTEEGIRNTVRNGVNRVLRGTGRAAFGLLGEDTSSADYQLKRSGSFGREGPNREDEPPILAAA